MRLHTLKQSLTKATKPVLEANTTPTEKEKLEGWFVIDTIKGPITKEQLEGWLKEVSVQPNQYSVTNGRLDINTSLDLTNENFPSIPIPLGTINGSFNASNDALQSFQNFPTKVTGDFFVFDTNIPTLEGLNIEVGGNIDLAHNEQLNDFRKIHKHITKMKGEFVFEAEHVITGGLGIILIEGIQEIISGNDTIDKVLNEHMDDPMECQELLIEAGMANFARV